MLAFDVKLSKRQSAFCYAILESLEGVCCFRTQKAEDSALCLLEVYCDPGFREDLEHVLTGLRSRALEWGDRFEWNLRKPEVPPS